MRIRTIHRSVFVGDPAVRYEFTLAGPDGTFEGEVPDEVGKILLSIVRRSNDYVNITPKEESPKVEPVQPALDTSKPLDTSKTEPKAKAKKE